MRSMVLLSGWTRYLWGSQVSVKHSDPESWPLTPNSSHAAYRMKWFLEKAEYCYAFLPLMGASIPPTLNKLQAHAEKASSCPLSSSPSPIEVKRLAPSSANLLSTAWAKAQNCGYMREPRPKTQYLCDWKEINTYYSSFLFNSSDIVSCYCNQIYLGLTSCCFAAYSSSWAAFWNSVKRRNHDVKI